IVRQWGIDNVVIERVQVGAQGGPEAAARTARRAALTDVASQRGIDQILLAHTREDQAETVLLRLARGSGARSIASMTPCDPPWHRPFLDVPRDVVHRVAREYLEPLGVEAWDDPHNHDPEFTRVRVREAMTLMEERLGPGFVPGLARSAHLLADDADALEAWAQGAFDRWVHVTKGECGVDVEAIAGQPRAVRTRLIRLMHQAVLESEDSLDFDHVQHVEAMISSWKGQGPAQLPGAITARVEYGRLTFHRGSSGEMSAT
ncbi:MAG: tRNA lysidine(34) synthetase, partial [Candidatus Nanopelagicales bacterium]